MSLFLLDFLSLSVWTKCILVVVARFKSPSSTTCMGLRRMAPSYLADTCIPVSSTAGRRQHLRSAAHHNLSIPCSRLAQYGSHSFATSGPSIWNSLPMTLCNSTLTFNGFCSRLKTERYNQSYGGHSTLVIGFYKRRRT